MCRVDLQGRQFVTYVGLKSNSTLPDNLRTSLKTPCPLTKRKIFLFSQYSFPFTRVTGTFSDDLLGELRKKSRDECFRVSRLYSMMNSVIHIVMIFYGNKGHQIWIIIPSLSLSPMPVYFWQAIKSMHVAISPLVSKHSCPPGFFSPSDTLGMPSPSTATGFPDLISSLPRSN